MHYLFDHWPTVAAKIRGARHRLFLFDYDGSLTAIAAHPSLATLPQLIRNRLRILARSPRTHIGIISGRGVLDLRRCVALSGLTYVGNHGLETATRSGVSVLPAARKYRSVLKKILHLLNQTLAPYPGAWIEDKGVSLSIHFRKVAASQRRGLRRELARLLGTFRDTQGLRQREGKSVIDLFPDVQWNKGSSAQRLRRSLPRDTAVLYLGDDTTDEDAFRALPRPAITIRVGKSRTSRARYFLKRQSETAELLRRLVFLN